MVFEQVLEISPPKNLAIWSPTYTQREKERKTERERGEERHRKQAKKGLWNSEQEFKRENPPLSEKAYYSLCKSDSSFPRPESDGRETAILFPQIFAEWEKSVSISTFALGHDGVQIGHWLDLPPQNLPSKMLIKEGFEIFFLPLLRAGHMGRAYVLYI